MRTIPTEWRDLVEVVVESTEEDVARLLTSEERTYRERFHLMSRQVEWGAARVAARRLAMRRGIVGDPLELEIVTRGTAPIARAGERSFFLSFSHTHGMAVAALDERPIGVDLEVPRPIDPRVAKFFLSGEEKEIAFAAALDDALIHFWAAKEAAFKFFEGPQLLSNVRLSEVSFARSGMTATIAFEDQRGHVATQSLPGIAILALAR